LFYSDEEAAARLRAERERDQARARAERLATLLAAHGIEAE
jgi:hypothetical protein